MVDMKSIQKLSALINLALLTIVTLLLGFYKRYGVTYMYYHSLPTIAIYAAMFYLIYTKRLYAYLIGLYTVLTVYQIAATVCLGYNAGYHLYSMSLIPLSFYMDYLARKLNTKRVNAILVSLTLACAYLVSTGYTVLKGPVYQIDARVAFTCMVCNAIGVFCFLIGYSMMVNKLIVFSEDKLSDMANTDRLTGLFNRHYMTSHLDALWKGIAPGQWVAMADIDDFKKINDTYGHNCGDYVLIELAKIMRDVCQGCTISRWGGEEFLIISSAEALATEILEKLRRTVEETAFSYQGKSIPVTITIGVSAYQAGEDLNTWLRIADDKLYEGKNSGKNRVIHI